jgi:predicted dehydrogenase
MNKALRVAIVGCGQIADAHLQEIAKIPTAVAVAVCDREMDLARQAAARFCIEQSFSDMGKLLQDVRPDVVHITTPPHTHAALAKQAIVAGAHVYVEKPFSIDAAEAREILSTGKQSGRLVCVGHDQLHDPAWEECRRLHRDGVLGEIVHVDSAQGYNLNGPFGKAFLNEPDHWIHRLPGGLFQNVMSHAMYRVTEFLLDETPDISATWYGHEAGKGLPTELRAMMRGSRTTAHLLFSSSARPVSRVARICGTRQSVEVDLDCGTVRRCRMLTMPGPFAKLQAPFRHFTEASRSLARGAWRFCRGEIQFFAGMRRLFTLFYDAIREGKESPISPAEILRVTRIMDRIFESCRRDTLGSGPDATHDAIVAARW